MELLITGVTGQLGYEALQVAQTRGLDAYGASRADFSLAEKGAARDFILQHRPQMILHAAAYTAVDKAEDEKELAYQVNAEAAGEIAQAAQEVGAKVLYVSTDYVFPGTGTDFYAVDDPKGPLNVYGASKLAGEEAVQKACAQHFIVRISWVFGENGKNFIKTMLHLADTHSKLTVVNDQIGSPTYVGDLAPLLLTMLTIKKYGTYHATNEGVTSWAGFAREIFRQAGKSVCVEDIRSEERPSKAQRPKNSRMSKQSLDEAGFERLPRWEDALARFLGNLQD